jgi:hypothetical protein
MNQLSPIAKTRMTHFATAEWDNSKTHLSHLLHPLRWPGKAEDLAATMDRVFDLTGHFTMAFGLGAPGPYDLLLMPNRNHFSIYPNIEQHRRVGDVDARLAASFIPLIGDNGCGPDDPEQIVDDLNQALAAATRFDLPVCATGYGGLYEVIVKPDASWLMIPAYAKTLELFDMNARNLAAARDDDSVA